MPPSVLPETSGPILLVDDEIELVEAVSSLLRAEFGEHRVKATNDAKLAATWIDQEKPGVLITDLRMPEHTGLNLLERSQHLWGPTPAIIITAFPSEAVSKGARKGRFAYLPKPFHFRALLEAIRQLESTPPASFSGSIALTTLTDLIQLYAISNRTGNLSVKSGELRGEIFFEQGRIIHAETRESTGFDAFSAILQWPQGAFAWYPRRTEQRSIEMNVPELMLEVYRIQDEQAQQQLSTYPPPSSEIAAPSIPQELEQLRQLEGFLGAALVDTHAGVLHAIEGAGPSFKELAASNTALVEQKRELIARLQLQDEIEDILITLGKQYHLIRPMRSRPGVFFYLVVDRERANLALTRLTLALTEHEMRA